MNIYQHPLADDVLVEGQTFDVPGSGPGISIHGYDLYGWVLFRELNQVWIKDCTFIGLDTAIEIGV